MCVRLKGSADRLPNSATHPGALDYIELSAGAAPYLCFSLPVLYHNPDVNKHT